MNRPSLFARHPSIAPIALVLGWLAMGMLEGLGF